MRKYVYISLLLLTSALFWQCMPGREASRSETSKLRVSWKLLSNFSDVKDGFHARFVLKNEGETTLGASNWALFFNMAPRPILPNRTPQPARVEHINGDWYKLVPEKDFTLTPGDSVTIPYAGTEGVIKETDAPLGLYLVYYDENGKETGIEQIDRYTIEPFTAREQVLRGEADQLSVPDATQRYLANLALSPVPENELIPIIPSPVSYQKGNGTFQLDGALAIRAGAGLEQEARFLRKSLFDITKVDLPISGESGRGINLSIEPLTINGTSKEAYRLTIQKDGITVVGS
jgi:hexosaminidase